MSTVKQSAGYPEDLSIRSRRGCLSPDEQKQLERVLQSSASLRIAHRVGIDFDRISSIRAGDDALVQRSLEAALTRRSQAVANRRGRSLAAALGAAALVGASAAAASVLGWWPANEGSASGLEHQQRHASSVATATRQTKRVPDSARKGAASTVLAPTAHAEPAAPPLPPQGARAKAAGAAPAPISPVPPSARPSADTASRPSVEASAEALFQRATSARRAGDMRAARDLFMELQRLFPASDEAHLSRVSLGKLLLSAGRAREAELQFGRYLAGGAGALAEEAWVGRAESLRRLGRTAEEERAWRTLLERYPASLYVTRARQRLAELAAHEP